MIGGGLALLLVHMMAQPVTRSVQRTSGGSMAFTKPLILSRPCCRGWLVAGISMVPMVPILRRYSTSGAWSTVKIGR